jgi:hypothetical protein
MNCSDFEHAVIEPLVDHWVEVVDHLQIARM